jgi:hypothetical protein
LAEKLSEISEKKYTTADASHFIRQFFERFPEVKNFTEKVIESCRKNGYVQTISRRKRYLPDINSEDNQRKNYAQRQAVNTIIQGSASDIVKQAMLKIRLNLACHLKNKAQLVMQIHDEIVVELYDPSKVEETVNLMKECMSCVPGINQAVIPFPVSIKVGTKLGDLQNHSNINNCSFEDRASSIQKLTTGDKDWISSTPLDIIPFSQSNIHDNADAYEFAEIIRFDTASVQKEISSKLDSFRFSL